MKSKLQHILKKNRIVLLFEVIKLCYSYVQRHDDDDDDDDDGANNDARCTARNKPVSYSFAISWSYLKGYI